MSSTLTLTFPHSVLVLELTKAEVIESFDEILKVECEAYYEGIQERLEECMQDMGEFFYASLTLSSPIPSKRIASDSQTFSLVGESLNFMHNISNQNSLNQKFFFSFVLYSPLILLKHNISSRIFSWQSVVDVVCNLLFSYTPLLQKEIDCSMLQGSYPPLEYITQYQESDLHFIHRLCFNSGIFLFEKDEKIYLCDTPFITQGENTSASYESLVGKHSFPYVENLNNPLGEEHFHHLNFFYQLCNKKTFFSSFNPYIPSVFQTQYSLSLDSKESQFCSLLHVMSYTPSSNSSQELQSHLLALRAQMQDYVFSLKSNIIDLKLGDEIQINSLSSSPLPPALRNQNDRYKIISITHHFKDKANLSSTYGGEDQSLYENTLLLLPLHIPFFTQPRSKPKIMGGVLGLVSGESDENILKEISEQKNTIHTDTQGRIKVVFAYSLAQATLDQQRFQARGISTSLNTCYLRVLTPIASENSGFFAVPRIGDEVLIEFLEGDCDKPFVAGSFYNSTSPIPQDHHFTSLSASTLGKDYANLRSEITLKPSLGEEEIYIHAQKDWKKIVQNNDEELIKHNQTSTVQGTKNTHIALASIENIGGLKDVNVGAESMENVALCKDLHIGENYTINVGGELQCSVSGGVRENIAGSKEIKIQEGLIKEISADEQRKILGNKKQNIQGEYQLDAQKNIDLQTQAQISLQAKENIDLQAEHFSLLSKESAVFQSKSSSFCTNDGAYIEDDKEITLKVKDGAIQIKNESIVLKVGGIEVVIDKNGLTLKGGEIKAQ